MNSTLLHLSLQKYLGSPYLTVTERRIQQNINIRNSMLSRFSSSFLYSKSANSNLNFQLLKFSQFRKTPVIMNAESPATSSTAYNKISTQKVMEDEKVVFERCQFIECYGDEVSGGAISCGDFDSKVLITKCIFAKCAATNSHAGAIFVPKYESLSISKSCFGRCYSKLRGNVLHISGNKKLCEIFDSTFSENGVETVDDTIYLGKLDLHLKRSNITANKAITGAFLTLFEPVSTKFIENNFVENVGQTGVTFLNLTSNTEDYQLWTNNNFYYNKLEYLLAGETKLQVSGFFTYKNQLHKFSNLGEESKITFKNTAFDFPDHLLVNKGPIERRIFEFRQDTEFNVDNLSPHVFSNDNNDYCNPFVFRRPFMIDSKINNYLSNFRVEKHPHMFFFIILFFIIILIVIYILLNKKTDMRQGMMRLA